MWCSSPPSQVKAAIIKPFLSDWLRAEHCLVILTFLFTCFTLGSFLLGVLPLRHANKCWKTKARIFVYVCNMLKYTHAHTYKAKLFFFLLSFWANNKVRTNAFSRLKWNNYLSTLVSLFDRQAIRWEARENNKKLLYFVFYYMVSLPRFVDYIKCFFSIIN